MGSESPGRVSAIRLSGWVAGCAADELHQFDGCRSHRRTAMVATNNGLAWIDPAHIVRNGLPPPVSILSIGAKKAGADVGRSQVCRCTHTVEIDYTALAFHT